MDTTAIPMSADEIIVRLSHLARTAPSASLQLRALGMLMRVLGMLTPGRKSRTAAPPTPGAPAPSRIPAPTPVAAAEPALVPCEPQAPTQPPPAQRASTPAPPNRPTVALRALVPAIERTIAPGSPHGAPTDRVAADILLGDLGPTGAFDDLLGSAAAVTPMHHLLRAAAPVVPALRR